MFTKASLRLAAWYVAIIMALSLAFSVWVYREATHELQMGLDRQAAAPAIIARSVPAEVLYKLMQEQLETARKRILGNLILLNIGVMVTASVGGYFLARKTLRPIEEAVEAQNRFTADASHELRTPLTTMKTEIEVALRDPEVSKKDLQDLLASNIEEIDRLSGLTQGLLTLARSDMAVSLGMLDAKPVLERIVVRFTPQAAEKHIRLKVNFASLRIKAEEGSLETILGILLDNAIKYSKSNTTVTVSMDSGPRGAQIAIQDQGLGIKASDISHIFERFYRADTARSGQNVSGHGLGLSIAQKLAELLHARITVRSTPGKGSTFTLHFSNESP